MYYTYITILLYIWGASAQVHVLLAGTLVITVNLCTFIIYYEIVTLTSRIRDMYKFTSYVDDYIVNPT